MEHLFKYIADNWALLGTAPFLVIVVLAIGLAGGWWVRSLIDRQQVAAARERVSLAEEKLQKKESGLGVPAVVSGGSITQLHRGVLHPDAEHRLVRELARHRGKAITMRALSNRCAQRCVGELRRAFEAAGWKVTSAPWTIIGELTGVWLSPKNKEAPGPAAEAAAAALLAAGFEIAMGQNDSLPDDVVELIIGNPEPI